MSNPNDSTPQATYTVTTPSGAGSSTHTVYKAVPDDPTTRCWEHPDCRSLAVHFVHGRPWCGKHAPQNRSA